MRTKICSICSRELPVTEFYKTSGAKCKGCFNRREYKKRESHKAYVSEWQRLNREYVNEYYRAYRAKRSAQRVPLTEEEKRQRRKEAERQYRARKRIARDEAKSESLKQDGLNGRVCRECGERKPLEGYGRGRKTCKACTNKKNIRYMKKRKDFDPEFKKRQKHFKAINQFIRRGAPGRHTFEEWEALKSQCLHTCNRCGRQEPEIKLTRDHIIPIAKGGTNDICNIQPLCLSCNSRKSSK